MTNAVESLELTRVGPGTPMGGLMREYWLPALQASEVRAGGEPVRLMLLGEKLIAFRDANGVVGVRIPDLKKFSVFERNESGDIVAVLRPVSSAGIAVLNHPCLDLWIGATVSVQMMDGSPAVDEAASGTARGRELFRGPIAWNAR